MKSAAIYSAFLYSLLFSAVNAQFTGLNNFSSDTVLLARLKQHNVKCVVEYLKENDVKRFNGRYCFNQEGKVTDMISPRGNAYSRVTYGYDEFGQVTGVKVYGHSDTVNVDNWKKWTLDEKHRITREVRGYVLDGKTTEYTSAEWHYLKDGIGTRQIEIHQHDRSIPADYVFHARDSIAEQDTFLVTYQFRKRESQQYAEKKTVTCMKRRGDLVLEHELEYDLFGSREIVKTVGTKFYRYGKKGELLEYGEINNKEGYLDYMQNFPDDYRVNYYAPVFVSGLLQGKTPLQKNTLLEQTFDVKGNLLTKSEEGYRHKFTYDTAGLLVKQELEGKEYGRSIQLHQYNQKGLILKAVLTETDPEGKKYSRETTYIYSYF